RFSSRSAPAAPPYRRPARLAFAPSAPRRRVRRAGAAPARGCGAPFAPRPRRRAPRAPAWSCRRRAARPARPHWSRATPRSSPAVRRQLAAVKNPQSFPSFRGADEVREPGIHNHYNPRSSLHREFCTDCDYGFRTAAEPVIGPAKRPDPLAASGMTLTRDNATGTLILSVIMPAAQKAPQQPQASGKPLKKGDHLFLVDGSSYIFRAYHALPPINRKSDGLQLNAVFGFCNMLWKLLRDMKADEKPTHLAVVFDLSERTFRTEMYPDYKAHRPDPPDDLRPQFGLIREAVHAFDLPCLEQKGFEADDLIATYVRQACEAGATATIVSSDKDLMQLVSDRVIMFDTMKDKKIGRAEVVEKFGVPPEKVIEVQSLIGDSTDNVPGVPGIGVKTAAQLIGEYGDLETLLRRATEIKQEKRRQSLIENADKARLSKKLVTLDTHVKLDVPIDDLAVHEPDHKRLVAFLKAMEFSSLTRRVAEFSSIDVAEIAPDAKLAAHGASSPPPLAGEVASEAKREGASG